MTPEQLRNSILQLAIQGKLVEQRKEEGTGEELYKEIQEEKLKIIEEGKLKKQKDLPDITEDEIPFEIPETWRWVRLGEIVKFSIGKTPPRAEAEWWSNDFPWVSISDMKDYGFVKSTKERVSINAVNKKICEVVSKETLLMSFKLTVGRTSILKIDAVHNEAIISIFPFIDNNYSLRNILFYILPIISQWGDSKNAIKGITLNTTSINNLIIPLPPLAEQKRIVEKIEELLPLVDRYEKVWTRLEDLNKKFPLEMQKSILQEAIQGKLVEQRKEEGTGEELFKEIQKEKQKLIEEGKLKKQKLLPKITEDEIPFDIPETWKWVRLGDIGFTNIGLTYKPTEISNDGTIVLRSSNIQNGKLDFSDIVRVNKDISEAKMCQVGDILICARNGSKKLVGKAALISLEGMSFGAFMAIYRSKYNEYVLHFINSTYFRNALLPETGTTTINQLTQDSLKSCIVPLPPLAEQKRIVEKIEELSIVCEKLKSLHF